jgi:outer membrane protein TolC
MLDAAIEAQEAKVGIERARYYPDLAVAGNVGFAWTNAAQDQHNPWIYDPLNYASYGLALVLECPFDFGMDYARVDEAEATLRRMRQQREALAQASLVEVDDAVAGLHEAGGRMEAWDRGRLAAKRWLIAVLQGMTLGLHEASDLTDALVAYFQNELNYLNAVYDYDMAWARLALTTGGHFLDGVEFVP